MQNNKNHSKVLKSLGSCYTIDHQAICQALSEESLDLLKLYNKDNPIGSFVFMGDEGVRFIPLPNNPEVFTLMANPKFQEQLTQMLEIILKKVPEYMLAEGLERQSYENNMAKMSEVLFTLLIDIESLKSFNIQHNEPSNVPAYQAINEAARFIGILSDEYGVQGQAVAFNEESAIKLEIVSRKEVGLDAKNLAKSHKVNETIH